MLFFFWILCIIAAAAVGSRRDRAGIGFCLGLLFGPFGILFAFLLTGNRVACPYCRELIHKAATICPRCQKVVGPVEGTKDVDNGRWYSSLEKAEASRDRKKRSFWSDPFYK